MQLELTRDPDDLLDTPGLYSTPPTVVLPSPAEEDERDAFVVEMRRAGDDRRIQGVSLGRISSRSKERAPRTVDLRSALGRSSEPHGAYAISLSTPSQGERVCAEWSFVFLLRTSAVARGVRVIDGKSQSSDLGLVVENETGRDGYQTVEVNQPFRFREFDVEGRFSIQQHGDRAAFEVGLRPATGESQVAVVFGDEGPKSWSIKLAADAADEKQTTRTPNELVHLDGRPCRFRISVRRDAQSGVMRLRASVLDALGHDGGAGDRPFDSSMFAGGPFCVRLRLWGHAVFTISELRVTEVGPNRTVR